MFICKSLTQPDLNGLQTCIEWAEFNLPALTPSQAESLTYYIILAFVAAWCFKKLGSFISSFK